MDNKCLPNVLFIEHIPNLERLDFDNYTKQRPDALVEGMREIHKALVLHRDVTTRNMMIVEDDPQRCAMWIDFNSSATLNEDTKTGHDRSSLYHEDRLISDFKPALVS